MLEAKPAAAAAEDYEKPEWQIVWQKGNEQIECAVVKKFTKDGKTYTDQLVFKGQIQKKIQGQRRTSLYLTAQEARYELIVLLWKAGLIGPARKAHKEGPARKRRRMDEGVVNVAAASTAGAADTAAEVLPGTTQAVSMTPPGCEEEAAGWDPELVQEMGRKLAALRLKSQSLAASSMQEFASADPLQDSMDVDDMEGDTQPKWTIAGELSAVSGYGLMEEEEEDSYAYAEEAEPEYSTGPLSFRELVGSPQRAVLSSSTAQNTSAAVAGGSGLSGEGHENRGMSSFSFSCPAGSGGRQDDPSSHGWYAAAAQKPVKPSLEVAKGVGGSFHQQQQQLPRKTLEARRENQGSTKPVSKLQTKQRALKSTTAEAQHQGDRSHTRSKAEQQHGGHGHGGPSKVTQLHPFRLQTDVRGALHQQEMQAELAADKARAEQQRRVKARPLPVSLDKPVVPTKPEPKPATLFNLKGEVRHQQYEKKHKAKLQQEQEEAARLAAKFKARPMSTAGPFVVHESDAPLAVPQEPNLATGWRSATIKNRGA